MKSLDLRDVFSAMVTVALLAITIGKFDSLRAFALKEGTKPLRGIATTPFFPKGYEVRASK